MWAWEVCLCYRTVAGEKKLKKTLKKQEVLRAVARTPKKKEEKTEQKQDVFRAIARTPKKNEQKQEVYERLLEHLKKTNKNKRSTSICSNTSLPVLFKGKS